MQILDLFSGIGGFSLGFESANFKDYDFLKLPTEQESVSDGFFKTTAFCEIDINCHKVLKKHWANVPIFNDVTKITKDDLAPLGKIDIITGGFPCQDLSIAGKRAGLSGSRSGLFSEILRLARITDARFILFENSSELITNKAYFKVFTQELRECGYEYRAFLLRASAYGYMHERKRAYVIAYTDKVRRFCDETLFNEVSNANIQEPSREIISIHNRRIWRKANGYENDLRDIRKDDGFCENVERIGMLGNSVVPEIVARFARFIKRIENGL
ncbi:DNA (cytosine-5-)-methyltransferase [Campylobacter hyointestinalis]|uniref:DNA (cytosine-5-)-methyltransferase n=1 Tax=Campylobacter hyointestinalis TaxID=198 RepID=UPI00072BB2E7|nr:DNA (cytosine-5-)-methyltransferase [Campylobacter hyointestinalis]CUU77313.1 cytosine-specific methyltransferase NlaX [Campylobacter hyointestinalis subsp. hyointestinalis]